MLDSTINAKDTAELANNIKKIKKNWQVNPQNHPFCPRTRGDRTNPVAFRPHPEGSSI
jgi:hypothetical protein